MGFTLADEVSLGKTIEAGLVIIQNWAEGRRLILISPGAYKSVYMLINKLLHFQCATFVTRQ
jgi:hypothetical protein